MLTCLRVQSFAIIDELEVEFGPGLNVVTGETGAGKSILVDAIELVLGARGRPEVVRTGEREAEVEALFELGDDPHLRGQLEEAGLPADGELVVRRVVRESGRTRAYINGRLATAAQLAGLANGLADISSQHEHQGLSDPATHLGYLDAFAGLGDLRGTMADAHRRLLDAQAHLDELRSRAQDRFAREDLLSFQLREIEEVAPAPGEEDALHEERERLRYAERLARVAGGAEEALYATDGALSEQLARIASELGDAAGIDASLAPLAEQLDQARAQIEDVARELGAYARNVTTDTGRLEEVQERLERLAHLKRKYGGSLEAVLEHRERAAAELAELGDHEERLEEAEAQLERARDGARRVASELSERRQEAGRKLGLAITDELASLGMGEAVVQVEVARLEGRPGELSLDGARLTGLGLDRAEFLIAPNRGEQARPLRRIASGGELSRSLLAIKRVLAGLGPAGLYVFDEVDAGVGGAVAEVIGRKLADVAKHHQVLCITHLPQIAVYADQHFRVHKGVVEDRTRSEITRLGKQERLDEIARMLGGIKVTPKTRAAAGEMLRTARP